MLLFIPPPQSNAQSQTHIWNANSHITTPNASYYWPCRM